MEKTFKLKSEIVAEYQSKTNPHLDDLFKSNLRTNFIDTGLNVAAKCYDPGTADGNSSEYDKNARILHDEIMMMHKSKTSIDVYIVISNSDFINEIKLMEIISSSSDQLRQSIPGEKYDVESFLDYFWEYSQKLAEHYSTVVEIELDVRLEKLCRENGYLKMNAKDFIFEHTFHKERPEDYPIHNLFLRENNSADKKPDLHEIVMKYGYFHVDYENIPENGNDKPFEDTLEGYSVVLDVINKDEGTAEKTFYYYVHDDSIVLIIPKSPIPTFSLEDVKFINFEYDEYSRNNIMYIRMKRDTVMEIKQALENYDQH